MNDAIDARALRTSRLAGLAALRVAGPEAKAFLQGQLSADLQTLTPENVVLASCNSVQGRVQAVLWIVERTDCLALVTAASVLESAATRLRKYVLRSKVTIDAGKPLYVYAVEPQPAAAAERGHLEREGVSFVRLPGHTQTLLLDDISTADHDPAAEQRWNIEHIRAGLPTVFPQTHEAFVAQMLNIDLLGGISFNKGCYTGQEIIARAHYRGAVKRRMFRFRAACPPPAPGTRLLAGDQHAGDVVDAAATDSGCELLAVVSLAQAGQSLTIEGASAASLEQLELPYAISRES